MGLTAVIVNIKMLVYVCKKCGVANPNISFFRTPSPTWYKCPCCKAIGDKETVLMLQEVGYKDDHHPDFLFKNPLDFSQ